MNNYGSNFPRGNYLKPSPEGEGVNHVDEVDLQPLAVVVGDG